MGSNFCSEILKMGSNLGSENENILVKFGGYQSSYRPKLPTEVIDHGDLFKSKQITSTIFFFLDSLGCFKVYGGSALPFRPPTQSSTLVH